MNHARTSRLLPVLLSVLFPLLVAFPSVSAAMDPFALGGAQGDNQYKESPGDVWKESRVTLPAYPRDGDLIPVPMAPDDTLKVYVDRNSVSRAPDHVLRFTLVVETAGGARNVFFDGIRCETKEYKTYAYGTDAKTLQAAHDPRWQAIPVYPHNAFRYNLYRNYACNDAFSARTPDAFLHKIQYGN